VKDGVSVCFGSDSIFLLRVSQTAGRRAGRSQSTHQHFFVDTLNRLLADDHIIVQSDRVETHTMMVVTIKY
jgi:hypothetical protein